MRRLGLLVFGAAFVLLFVVVAIAQGLGNPGVPSGDVAFVEDAPGGVGEISETDFQRALQQAALQSGLKKVPKPSDEQYGNLVETALGGLLDIAWIEGAARELGISASDKEVAAEFKKLKSESFGSEKEYKEFLKESGFNRADIDARVRVQILSNEIQSRFGEETGTPSKSEVEAYYEEAKSTQFTQQASRDVRLIVNEDRDKIKRAKIQLGKDDSAKAWKRLAKQYSEDEATKEEGGLQRGVTEGTLEEPLNAAVFGTPEGQVEGPVKTSRGFYVFEVENTTPEEVQPLADVEAQVESQLSQQAQQETFARFVADFTSKWTSRTFCASDVANERCANFEGAGRPAGAPPTCYEANPEGGLPEACPAPVSQLIPALPGSVSLLEPRGRPLPQRPRPAGLEAAAATAPGGAPLPAP